jgi:protease PrsW
VVGVGIGAAPRGAWRQPLTWLVLVLGLIGLFVLANGFAVVALVFPSATVIAFLVMVLSGLVGSWLLSRVRPLRPARFGWSVACVAWGMTGAAGLATIANHGLLGVWSKTAGLDFGSAWGPALTAPVNEEALKLVGLMLLAWTIAGLVRAPIDGFVYGAMVGLGFQIVENCIYAVNSIVQTGATAPTISVLQTSFARIALTGLGTHWTMTGVAGAGFGYLVAGYERPRRRRAGVLLIALAVAMHWQFNVPLATSVGTAITKTLINLAIAVSLGIVLRRKRIAGATGFLVSHGVSPADASVIVRPRRRRRALRQLPLGEARGRLAAWQQGWLTAAENAADSAGDSVDGSGAWR